MPAITLSKSGLLTTVQDLGRFGFGRFGVPRSGAMDTLALRMANRLVGNSDSLSALEITAVGPEIVFHQETCFALAGGNLTPALDHQPLQTWESYAAKPGAILRFGPRRQGARCYLAVPGGFIVPPVMGSASTDLDSGLGGIDGKPLRAGQTLEIAGGFREVGHRVRLELLQQYASPFELRFVREEDQCLDEATLKTFQASCYRISQQSNRMGYRLRGPRISSDVTADMISDAIPPGTIQAPPGGEPILLMAEGQCVGGGGYPRLGYVIRADLPKAAQLWPGHSICFREVSLDEASILFQKQELLLEGSIRR